MTVIAWDGKTLAADKRLGCNGYPATTTKIRRTAEGDLIGTTGDSGMGRGLMAWYESGANPSEYPANRVDGGCRSTMLVIRRNGSICLFGSDPYPIEIENRFHALGSGGDFALAAMHLGHDAYAAVKVATALDNDCGNGIDTLELE